MAEANRGCGLHEESSLWVSRWAKRQFLASGFFRSMYSFQVCEVLESSYHHWTTVLVVLIGCSVPDKSGFSVLSQIPKKFRTSEKREALDALDFCLKTPQNLQAETQLDCIG
ncbi:unnamed protein product [Dicrocoelium dendriticum]|nr:unnamed protein product [Dicrocoelium dendriticum]